jgi:hypothetical protein
LEQPEAPLEMMLGTRGNGFHRGRGYHRFCLAECLGGCSLNPTPRTERAPPNLQISLHASSVLI